MREFEIKKIRATREINEATKELDALISKNKKTFSVVEIHRCICRKSFAFFCVAKMEALCCFPVPFGLPHTPTLFTGLMSRITRGPELIADSIDRTLTQMKLSNAEVLIKAFF